MRTNVYFVQAAIGPIKVGFTADMRSRLWNFRGSAPCAIHLLLQTPGCWYLERKIKYLLRDDRCHGEWHTPTPRVMKMIDQLAAGGADALLSPDEMSIDRFPSSFIAEQRTGIKIAGLLKMAETGGKVRIEDFYSEHAKGAA